MSAKRKRTAAEEAADRDTPAGERMVIGAEMIIDPIIEAINEEIKEADPRELAMELLAERSAALHDMGYAEQALADAQAARAFTYRRNWCVGHYHMARAYKSLGNLAAAEAAALRLRQIVAHPLYAPERELLKRYEQLRVLKQQETPFDLAANVVKNLDGMGVLSIADPAAALQYGRTTRDVASGFFSAMLGRPCLDHPVALFTVGLAHFRHMCPLLRRRAERYMIGGLYDAALCDLEAIALVSGDAEACADLRVVCQALWDASVGAPIGDTNGRVAWITNPVLRAQAVRELTRLAHETITDIPPSVFCSSTFLARHHANFYGPVEIRLSPGKGRGLFTTADVKEGQLLLRENALFRMDSVMQWFTPANSGDINTQAGGSISVSNYFIHCIRDLAGPTSTGRLPEMLLSRRRPFNTDALGKQDYNNLMAAAGASIGINAFGGNIANSGRDHGGLQLGHHGGVWPVISFCNHSIESNTTHMTAGRFGWLRAAKDLPAGTELVLSYNPIDRPWERRRDSLLFRGFTEPRAARDMSPSVVRQVEALGEDADKNVEAGDVKRAEELLKRGRKLLAAEWGVNENKVTDLYITKLDPALNGFVEATRDWLIATKAPLADVFTMEVTRLLVEGGHQPRCNESLHHMMNSRAQYAPKLLADAQGDPQHPHMQLLAWMDGLITAQARAMLGPSRDTDEFVRLAMTSLPSTLTSKAWRLREKA